MKFSLVDLLWIFFVLAAVQPVISRRMADAMRQRKIAAIEKKRGSRVIVMVYRQETMRFLGFPIMRYIDMNNSEAVLRAIHMTDADVPLDIVLHAPGGLALAATQIARAIKSHPGKVTVFVPHMAMSGGTLIAIAADEIVMCEHSVIGSIDPQINGMPAASLIQVAELKPIAEVDDQNSRLRRCRPQSNQAVGERSSSAFERTSSTRACRGTGQAPHGRNLDPRLPHFAG